MVALTVSVAAGLVLAAALVLLRGTIAEVSLVRSNYGGMPIFIDIFGLVVPGVVLVNLVGVDEFRALRVTSPDTVPWISAVVLASILGFFVTFGLVARIQGLGLRFVKCGFLMDDPDVAKVTRLCWVLILLATVSWIIIISLGGSHALIGTLLGEYDSLQTGRFANRYDTRIPSVLFSWWEFLYTLLAVALGAIAGRQSKTLLLVGVPVVIVMATWSGQKLPPIEAAVVFCLAILTFRSRGRQVGDILAIAALGFVGAGAAIALVLLQYPDLSNEELAYYFFNRLGVGQISGLYDQLNIGLRKDAYLWHMVPFAGQVVDYPSFDRDLMVVSRGIEDPTTTGGRNSLFVSEAFAMGGVLAAVISPIVVGFNFAVSLAVLVKFGRLVWGISNVVSQRIMVIVIASYISLTGQFSSWPLFKGLILLLIFLTAISAPYLLWGMIGRSGLVRRNEEMNCPGIPGDSRL